MNKDGDEKKDENIDYDSDDEKYIRINSNGKGDKYSDELGFDKIIKDKTHRKKKKRDLLNLQHAKKLSDNLNTNENNKIDNNSDIQNIIQYHTDNNTIETLPDQDFRTVIFIVLILVLFIIIVVFLFVLANKFSDV